MKRRITYLGRSMRVARWFTAVAVLWLALGSVAWAAPKKPEETAAPTKSYVASYIIVILVFGAGMMAVLRPSTRADKIPDRRPDDDEEE
jgi:peptidoglycan/LPS O-acetylase OafA/YrhL